METSNHAPKLENGLDLRGNGVEVMLEYRVTARRIDSHGSAAEAKAARLVLDPTWPGATTPSIRPRCCWPASRPAC